MPKARHRRRYAQLQCSWRFRQGTAATDPVLVLPDGSVDLIWDGTLLLVAGPDRTAAMAALAPGSALSGVRLAAVRQPAC